MLKCDLVMFYICYKKYIHKMGLWLAGWLYAVYTVVGLSPLLQEKYISVSGWLYSHIQSVLYRTPKGVLGRIFFFFIYIIIGLL